MRGPRQPTERHVAPLQERLGCSLIQKAVWVSFVLIGLSLQAREPITEKDRAWWSFQPIKMSPPPHLSNSWVRTEVDGFVLDKLLTKQIVPNPEASGEALVRRLFFDLLGVPPSPAELRRFLGLQGNNRYETWVDWLLADSRYGERWARHWLDLVRYADSDGYRVDDYRPNAWRYRDYVIESLNTDKPYDRFICEQLAGDELWPEEPGAITATGYLRHWIYEYNNRDALGQWNTILNDITDTTADVFLGMGMQCARCHDHKFDPILQKDYYRLRAFFAGIQPRDDVPAARPEERAASMAKQALWEQRTESLRNRIREIEEPYRRQISDDARAKFPVETQAILRKPFSERTPLERQVADLAYRQIHHEYERLTPRLKPADKEIVAGLRKELAAFDSMLPPALPLPMSVFEIGRQAPDMVIPNKSSGVIPPGFPTIFTEAPAQILPPPQAPNSTGRRTALARWLTQADHPLTSRVMVNRVWQYHFGRGLVSTSSDFGHLGEAPSHPELLDWLAADFVKHGWSLKHLHRVILGSATYRQSAESGESSPGLATLQSRPGLVPTNTRGSWERASMVDPENRLLWRGNVTRLAAEQIRDALLTVSGELQRTNPGPSVDASKFHRSIYTKVLRNTRDPLLDVFDTPQHFSSTPQRDATTTALQSLHLLNNSFLTQRASAMARRLEREAPQDTAAQISLAYELAYSRRPAKEETEEAEQFLAAQVSRVDPELAFSAEAGFRTDKMPFRDGKAALLTPRSSQEWLSIPMHRETPTDGFTIEAYIYLHSIDENAQTRTLAASFKANESKPQWSLGVTGRKSLRKAQTLVLDYSHAKEGSTNTLSSVFSDLPIRLDRPYFVAAAVDLTGLDPHVRFFVKDLSNDDEPMLISRAGIQPNSAASPSVRGEETLFLGSQLSSQQTWDGMIDDVRLSRGLLTQEQLLHTSPGASETTLGFWRFESQPSFFRDTSPARRDIQPTGGKSVTASSRSLLALTDFCHALLNSSEFLYIP